jgi:hypothetical protein
MRLPGVLLRDDEVDVVNRFGGAESPGGVPTTESEPHVRLLQRHRDTLEGLARLFVTVAGHGDGLPRAASPMPAHLRRDRVSWPVDVTAFAVQPDPLDAPTAALRADSRFTRRLLLYAPTPPQPYTGSPASHGINPLMGHRKGGVPGAKRDFASRES